MIAAARQQHPGIAFQEGDAAALPFAEASFDAVVMNFGLLHLAQPEAALADACRVLRPGGRYAFTVWASPDQAVGFGMVLRAVEELGVKDVPLPEGPPFFRFSDVAESRRALEAAGFHDVTVRTLPLTGGCPRPTRCTTRARGVPPPRCCAHRRARTRRDPRPSAAGSRMREGRRVRRPMPPCSRRASSAHIIDSAKP
jgi:SAM-dependent methyltransferase